MNFYLDVGTRIKLIRKDANLNQEDFANRFGAKSKATVSDWEKGKTSPNLAQLSDIASFSGKSVDWIISGNDSKSNKSKRNLNLSEVEYKVEASVPAGYADFKDLVDNNEYEDLHYDPDNHFYLKIDDEYGFSMMPFLEPGDLVLVSFSEKVKDGDIVAARWDKTKGAIKILREVPGEKSLVVLDSYNPAEKPIAINRKKANIYKVVLVRKNGK